MATRATNTQQEALQRILGDISQIKTMPDADLEYLIGLETTILGKLREPFEAMQSQMGGPGGAPMPGAPAGPGGGGAPMSPAGPMGVTPMPPQGGVPGVMSRPPLPNPDELQRLLTKVAGPGRRAG